MKNDNSSLRNLVVYEIYVRNHGPNGTFSDVTDDLGRIKSMGIDIIWLMPIHPIGVKQKKGTLGCPYSIKDYRKVNPEYGSLDDFQELVASAHKIGLKVMIDVVFNHTSHDSVLVQKHPEYFHQDEHGQPITTVPAWSDVIDLKQPNQDLQKYLIESLCYWVEMGVDGFRCDVASIIPLNFWINAKAQTESLNPNLIWLAESVETGWIIDRRRNCLTAHADAELYQAFDITYDYDIWSVWKSVVTGKLPTLRYLEMVEFQKGVYPSKAIKMRCVENHDNARIMAYAQNETSAKAWTALEIFLPGAFLIYAGQESAATETPSLFDIDKIQWRENSIQNWLSKLIQIKKSKIFIDGTHYFLSAEPIVQSIWTDKNYFLYGMFNVNDIDEPITCQMPDGLYTDLISQKQYKVINQTLDLKGLSMVIFEVSPKFSFKPMRFRLLQHFDE